MDRKSRLSEFYTAAVIDTGVTFRGRKVFLEDNLRRFPNNNKHLADNFRAVMDGVIHALYCAV